MIAFDVTIFVVALCMGYWLRGALDRFGVGRQFRAIMRALRQGYNEGGTDR